MRVIKPLSVGMLTRPFERARRFHLGAAVLLYVPLGEVPALFSEAAMWTMLSEELPPEQALDGSMPKGAAEFLVTGRAFAPGGAAAPAVRVGAAFAGRAKTLIAVGDRHLEGDRATQPVPFTEMPLDWSRAYGGPKFAENPLGRGMEEMPLPGIGYRIALPNIQDPTVPPERRHLRPAGFGPIDQTWPQRARHAGTYDDAWLQNDFPGLPKDLDWRFFNLAPEDQRFPRAFDGIEEYAFENLHPAMPQLRGRLPGVAPRLFIARRGNEDTLEEVALGLTTVWFFPHRERAVLIHHGSVDIAEEDGRDVARLVLGADFRGAMRPAEHFRSVMMARLDPENGALLALRDSDLIPAELMMADPMTAPPPGDAGEGDILGQRFRERTAREIEGARAYVASFGLDPDEHAPTLPPPEEPPPDLETLPTRLERISREADEMQRQQEAEHAVRRASLDKELEASGVMTPAELEAEVNTPAAGPPRITAAGSRADLMQIALNARAAGGDPSEINDILNDPEMNLLWERSETQAREAYRLGAHHQNPAPALDAAANARIHAELAAGRAKPRADLCGADLRGLDLSGYDLTEAWLDGADLRGASLAGARLAGAVLAHGNFDGCNLAGADLAAANLGRAKLAGAMLERANLAEAVLTSASLENAVLRGAVLDGADLTDAKLAGADLRGARAKGLTLTKVALPGLMAAGAVFDGAVFIDCDLSGADLTGGSLIEAHFIRTVAPGLLAVGANLNKAAFAENCSLDDARFVGARLGEANLRATRLMRADFSEAILDGADLSDAVAAGARLFHVSARGARFIATDFRDAVLARGDFAGALLSRADLRGADLTEASFYEADLARVHTDRSTRYQGMFQTRMRLRPRRQAGP
ncbi:DUF2169 domain-containing protein [Roseomonas oryzicola]|uniref:DUF2169 domain-containing protein n=2 Tax=Neoroseomonas oryzicola TaxID=535904 RepID=A0ABX1EMK7_9PROT|nr:DUF2169 domain-containing protein [Neoroseomonas oryzicola]